jgi:PKD repeat protein
MSVQFVDQSFPGTASITSWLWNFGDGHTSTQTSPVHVYTTAGTYTVSLSVSSAAGSDIETRGGYVTATAPVVPTSDFAASPTSGAVPLRVQFGDQSTPGSGPVLSCQWDFGDGQTSTSRAPQHVYNTPGFYDVSLTVTTAYGTDLERKNVFINAVQSDVGPTSVFGASPTNGAYPLVVQFLDYSTPGSAEITSWLWDFGDGQTSQVQHPSHTYTTPGQYTVSLRVTTSIDADTTTLIGFITVEDAPSGVPVASGIGLALLGAGLAAGGALRARGKRR